MTREEAIKILQKLYEGCNKHKNTDLIKEAYNLAIEALKAQADLQPNCNELATDVISRQAAIDVEGIDEQIRCEMCGNSMHTDRGCDGNCKYDEKLYERIMQILGERIKPLPSAQPDMSEYSSKLLRNAYERGKRDAQSEEDCDTCKHGYFGDDQCNNCRVRYPSHYERRTDE